MEVPTQLKNLYRHWEVYTIERPELTIGDVFIKKELFDAISAFVSERIKIWGKRTLGNELPYTTDEVLATYRFCNIFREFDKQTIQFHALLNPYRDNFPLWLLNMFYCRMIARPETISSVGLLSFSAQENSKLYEKLMESSRPRYGTPYVFPISTIMRGATPTRELFITQHLPLVMEDIAYEIETWSKESVYDGVRKVLPLFAYNFNFLWTEVLIDVAYQFPERIDLFGRFPIGPGSLPTLHKINPDEDPTLLVQNLSKVPLDIGITYNGKPLHLSAENWEGIGCEFRKYTNLKVGKGRKRLYK